MSANSKKILFCGNTKGEVTKVFEKVKDLHGGKAGPFDALFIVGFWGKSREETEEKLADFKSGEQKIPCPTFFVDAANKTKDEPICPNLTALGSSGTRNVAGLSLAYCNSNGDTSVIVNSLSRDVKSEIHNGVDILLTTEWPEGILNGSGESKTAAVQTSKIATLTQQVKPRYHFSTSDNQFFERMPYRNTSGTNADITRFISLAAAFTPKVKFIHALNMTPISSLTLEYVTTSLKGEIPSDSPFGKEKSSVETKKEEFSKIEKQAEGTEYNRWGDSNSKRQAESTPKEQPRSKKQKEKGSEMRCWFCLSNKDAETHLILSVGNYFYLALPKGPINLDHLLIIPIKHQQVDDTLDNAAIGELQYYKQLLSDYYSQKGQYAFFFETKGSSTNHHANINVVGINQDDAVYLGESLVEMARLRGYALKNIGFGEVIDQANCPTHHFYFVAEIPEGRLFYQGEAFPFTFGRECVVSFLGLPPPTCDWRLCQGTRQQEEDLAAQWKKSLKPFDKNIK